MSERTTGATDAQIERAAKKLRQASQAALVSSQQPWDEIGQYRQGTWLRIARGLFDTEERIVSVSDLQWLLQIAVSVGIDADGQASQNAELIDRIQAAIGDAP